MKSLFLLLFLAGSTVLFSQSAERTLDCLDSLKIPTSFSPNGDSINDGFQIHFPCAPEQFEITIFNRWGNEIFTSKEYTFFWAGTNSSGSYVPQGVYFYSIKFTYLDQEKTIQGNVHVML